MVVWMSTDSTGRPICPRGGTQGVGQRLHSGITMPCAPAAEVAASTSRAAGRSVEMRMAEKLREVGCPGIPAVYRIRFHGVPRGQGRRCNARCAGLLPAKCLAYPELRNGWRERPVVDDVAECATGT